MGFCYYSLCGGVALGCSCLGAGTVSEGAVEQFVEITLPVSFCPSFI